MMRIALNPWVVFIARPLILVLGFAALDWSSGPDPVLDHPWLFYAVLAGIPLLFGVSELRLRLRTKAPSVIDLGALYRSRDFWFVMAMVAIYLLVVSRLIPFPEPRYSRTLIGQGVWLISMILSNSGRPKPQETSPYVQWPRLRCRKSA